MDQDQQQQRTQTKTEKKDSTPMFKVVRSKRSTSTVEESFNFIESQL